MHGWLNSMFKMRSVSPGCHFVENLNKPLWNERVRLTWFSLLCIWGIRKTVIVNKLLLPFELLSNICLGLTSIAWNVSLFPGNIKLECGALWRGNSYSYYLWDSEIRGNVLRIIHFELVTYLLKTIVHFKWRSRHDYFWSLTSSL